MTKRMSTAQTGHLAAKILGNFSLNAQQGNEVPRRILRGSRTREFVSRCPSAGVEVAAHGVHFASSSFEHDATSSNRAFLTSAARPVIVSFCMWCCGAVVLCTCKDRRALRQESCHPIRALQRIISPFRVSGRGGSSQYHNSVYSISFRQCFLPDGREWRGDAWPGKKPWPKIQAIMGLSHTVQ